MPTASSAAMARSADGDAPAPSRRGRKRGASKSEASKKADESKEKVSRRRKKPAKPEPPPEKAPDPLKREILGIAILAVSLCLMLALASFHLGDVDPGGSAAHTGHTRNLIGPVGALVADILLYVLGLAAFLLPLTLAVPGVMFIVGRRIKLKPLDVIGYPLLVLLGSMLAHLWMTGTPVMGHDAGGLVGTTGAEILKSLFGRAGAYIIVYASLALTFMFTTGISLVSVLRSLLGPIKAPIASLKGWWADKKKLRAERAEAKKAAREAREVEKAEAKARKAEEREAAREAKRAAREAEKAARAEKDSGPSPRVEVNFEGEPIEDEILDSEPPSDKPRVSERAEASSEAQLETDVIKKPRKKPSRKERVRKERAPEPVDEPRHTPAWALAEDPLDAPLPPEVDPFAFDAHGAPTGPEEVLEAGDSGVDFDDPLDREAVDGPKDTVFAPSARFEAPPIPDELPPIDDKPVVKERQHFNKEPLPDGPVIDEEQAGYELPPLSFLDFERPDDDGVDPAFLQNQADRLVQALDTFRIQGRVTEIHPGPVVTMFEFEPAPGVRISKIAGLADDLAMALKAIKVRIVAPIPGKGVVGFEVPNVGREMVYLKEIIGSPAFRKKHALPIALGKDIHGAPVVADLARMPHLLVAGTTGSGKSVGVNCMIASMLYHAGPDEIRLIMVDPKMLELSVYEDIPHLLLPVVTDPKKAAQALKWAVDEMERRYQLMKEAGVRNLKGFNKKVEKYAAEAEAVAKASFDDADLEGDTVDALKAVSTLVNDVPEKLPYIVVIIDEFADLMMVAGKEVEYCVARIAQKARAAGIHLILATQRPSTDVITGVIKANFPTRMAFQVSSGIDSRTILSTNGAENLLGKGDMLYMPPGTARLMRVHGAFVSEEELHDVVEFIKDQAEPDYLDESILTTDEDREGGDGDDDYDDAYEDAVRVVYRDGRASTSHLQRRLSLGYNRAARIVDCMEREGLVGPGSGAKPREIYKSVIADLINRWDGNT